MANQHADDFDELEEQQPRRWPGRALALLVVAAVAGGAYMGAQQYRALEAARADLAALRAHVVALDAKLDAVERELAKPPAPLPEQAARGAAGPSAGPAPRAPERPAADQPKRAPAVHVVKPGDTLWGIAEEHDVDLRLLQQANPGLKGRALRAGQRLAIPSRGLYVEVKRGDTLSALASRYGVSVTALTAANDLDDPDHLPAGVRLFIPVRRD